MDHPPLVTLPNGQFEEDYMAFLREAYGEMYVVERGSFNHLMSNKGRKFRRNTYIDMGTCRRRGVCAWPYRFGPTLQSSD